MHQQQVNKMFEKRSWSPEYDKLRADLESIAARAGCPWKRKSRYKLALEALKKELEHP